MSDFDDDDRSLAGPRGSGAAPRDPASGSATGAGKRTRTQALARRPRAAATGDASAGEADGHAAVTAAPDGAATPDDAAAVDENLAGFFDFITGDGDAFLANARAAAKDADPEAVREAAERVRARAEAVRLALALHQHTSGPVAALHEALGDLDDLLHRHGARPAKADAEAIERALDATTDVAHTFARDARPHNRIEVALLKQVAAVRRNLGEGQVAAAEESPRGVLQAAEDSLSQLTGVRRLVDQVQPQAPQVLGVDVDRAIGTTAGWVARLRDDRGGAAARELARAVRDQAEVVTVAAAELREVIAQPMSATWADTVNAYVQALGQSTQRPAKAQAALERARRLRRRLPIDRIETALGEGNARTGALLEVDEDAGEQALYTQRALSGRKRAFEEQLDRGERVDAGALEELELDAREREFLNWVKTLDAQVRQTRQAVNQLTEWKPWSLKPTPLLIWQKHILAGLAGKLDRLREVTTEIRLSYDAWAQNHATDLTPAAHRARRRDAIDGMSQRFQDAVRSENFKEVFEDARDRLEDAAMVELLAVLVETIAMTLVGNVAGAAARGAVMGAMVGRAVRVAQTGAQAARATGVGEAAIAAERAATLLRAGQTAQQVGAMAGLVTESVVGALGQKYLQGDQTSLTSLIFVNLGTNAAIAKILGKLARAEAARATAATRGARVLQKAKHVVRAGFELGREAVLAGATDYALSKLVGRDVASVSEMELSELLVQGASMYLGKRLSLHLEGLRTRLDAIEVRAVEEVALLDGRADGLAIRARSLAESGDPEAAGDLLDEYAAVLDAEARILDRALTDAVDRGDAGARKQLVGMIRANNRATDALERMADGAAVEASDVGGRGGGRGGAGRGDDGAAGGGRAERATLREVAEVGQRTTVLVAGARHEGGSAFTVRGKDGPVPVEVVVGDASIQRAEAVKRGDGFAIEMSPTLPAGDVEIALAGQLAKVAHIELRRATGRAEATTDALGPEGKGIEFSPADYALVAELRTLQRQRTDAEAQGEAGRERLAPIEHKIADVERRMGLDQTEVGQARRRMVAAQLEVETDALRRDSERRRLDGDRGHAGVEVHTHWMGIVDVEVFRAKAAIAANGKDDGSWLPLLERIASYRSMRHGEAPDGQVSTRSTAGDAIAIAGGSLDQVRRMRESQDDSQSDSVTARAIETIAENAARQALVASPDTDFNSAYEIRDELVKDTFAGQRTRLPDVEQDKADAKRHANAGYDLYTREALLALAGDGVGYTEPSNSGKKMGERFQRDRVERAMDELIAEGKLAPGQVDVRFLAMVTTNHFGERPAELPSVAIRPGTEESWKAQYDQVVLQLREGHVAGVDIAGQELFRFEPKVAAPRIRALYAELVAAATARGQRLVLRPHVGEGAVDTLDGKPYRRDGDRAVGDDGRPSHYERAQHNLEVMLDVVDQLRVDPIFDGTKVELRFGHATHATADQAARMQELGVTAEVNLGSNVATGSLDQAPGADGRPTAVEQLQDHALPSFFYYGTRVILSTDAHSVMSTDLRAEYVRAQRVIDEVLSGARRIRVKAADAGNRGAEVPGQAGERALAIHELTAEERGRFLHAYEQLYADAEGYYQRRPGATPLGRDNPRTEASPKGGRHAIDLAVEHGLAARHGERVFEGDEAQVQAAAAAYRRQGYLVWMQFESDGRLIATVRSGGGDVELELRYIPDTEGFRAMPLDPYPPREQDRNDVHAAYKAKLAELGSLDAQWLAEGLSLEERARRGHAYRRRARFWARDQSVDAGDAAVLEVRDLEVHGNPEGPSFEELINRGLQKGKSLDEVYLGIIGSAQRSNAEVDAKYAPGEAKTP
jgi:hypothetical protein